MSNGVLDRVSLTNFVEVTVTRASGENIVVPGFEAATSVSPGTMMIEEDTAVAPAGPPPYPASQALRLWLEYLGGSDGRRFT
jgi:hypothetical protein